MGESIAPPGSWHAALTPNVRGALWMLASAVAFTVMTTLIKYLGADYSAALQTFYRQVAGFLILLPVIARHRGAAFATTRPGILIFRSAAGTIGLILSFYAYQKLPLADVNALSFTAPCGSCRSPSSHFGSGWAPCASPPPSWVSPVCC